MAGITLDVLGPTQVTSDGGATTLRPRERDVLAALALRHPQPVSLIELSGLLWNVAPASDLKTLQNHVARVRRALGADAVVTTGSSYSLGAQVRLDLVEFHEARASAVRAASVGDHRGAHLHFERALRLVRGEPFADLEATNAVAVARRTLEQSIGEAADSNLLALMDAGATDTALATAQQLVIGVRERRALLVSLAYYRAGRRLDALRALHGCRQALRDAGLTLGEPLVRMEQALLSDDPGLLTDDATSFTRSNPSTAPATGAPVLVGRDSELARLHALVTARFDAAASAPAVVVVGQRGVGTSAVCGRVALQARLAGWTVLETVRLPAADVLEAIDMTAERPLLVVVDGTDAYTDDDWRRIASESGSRTCVVATARVAPAEGLAHSVPIEPLARASVEQLVELTVGAAREALPKEFVDAVFEGSGGLPALVMELAIEGGSQPDASSVARRLFAGLSTTAQQLAAIVATSTVPVSVAQLLSVAARLHLDANERDVADCVARRVLVERTGGLLTSRDDAAREVLLGAADEGWLRSARTAWIAQHDADGDAHWAVADLLEELPDWPIDDAMARLDQAVALANAAVEYELVQRYATRAWELAIGLHGPDHPLVLRREIDIVWFSLIDVELAFSDDQWRLVDRLRALHDDANLVLLVGRMVSMIPTMEVEALDPRLVALIDEALTLPVDPAVRSATASAASDFFSNSDVERCRAFAELALEDADAADDDVLRIDAVRSLSCALGHPQYWERGIELGTKACSLAERLDDGLKRGDAMLMVFGAQMRSADPRCRASLDRLRALGDRHERPGYRFQIGVLGAAMLHVEGRLEESEAAVREAVEELPLVPSMAAAILWAQLFPVRVAQRRQAEMRDAIAQLAREQPRLGLWHGYLSWIEAGLGDGQAAVELLDEIDDGASLPHLEMWSAAAYSAARAAVLLGEPARCERFYSLLSPGTGLMAWTGTGVVGPIDLALGELQLVLGHSEQAAAHLAAATQVVRQLHAPVFEPELAALRSRLA